MSYPGNPAISPEVQQRIRSTFDQTLNLAERGSRQEAALGCDFILQLDPRFRPARTLQERLTASSGGGVEVDDLRGQLEGRPSAEEQEAEAAALFEETRPGVQVPDDGAPQSGNETVFAGGLPDRGTAGEGDGDDDLDDLGDLLDLPDLPDLDAGFDSGEEAAPAAAPPPAPEAPAATPADGGDGGGLRERLAFLVEARRFPEALELAQANQAAVVADPEAARLATLAGERQEAAPYVERFLGAAEKARQKADFDEAAVLTAKARSLDPSHPALAEAGTLPGVTTGGGEPAAAPPEADEPLLADPGAASAASSGAAGEPAPAESVDDFGLGDFDFDGGDAEGDRRIAELLTDGQGAFEREDYQGAIDSWSRIFLIDIDHEEASRRIEEARKLKNEQERRVEEVYHEAVQAVEEGRDEEAREGFQRVLALSPGYAAALEGLDRLDSGHGPALETGARPPAAPAAKADTAEPADGTDGELREQILIPPDPDDPASAAAAAGTTGPKGRTMVAAKGPASRRFLLIAGLVLVVVLAGGYLLWQERDSLFPNAAETPVEAPREVDPVDRATRLHESGKTAMAINLLRRLPPDAPQYEEAQALISQWEAGAEPAAVPVPEEPEDGTAGQAELLARAAQAVEAGELLRARDFLADAGTVADLPPEAAALETRVAGALQPLADSLDLMDQGEYVRALPELWRMHEDDPEDRDVRRLITDSYYALAIRALQQGDAATAADHLEEAAEMSPGPDMERHLRFARTYAQREKDLLYRIYVKYMPAR